MLAHNGFYQGFDLSPYTSVTSRRMPQARGLALMYQLTIMNDDKKHVMYASKKYRHEFTYTEWHKNTIDQYMTDHVEVALGVHGNKRLNDDIYRAMLTNDYYEKMDFLILNDQYKYTRDDDEDDVWIAGIIKQRKQMVSRYKSGIEAEDAEIIREEKKVILFNEAESKLADEREADRRADLRNLELVEDVKKQVAAYNKEQDKVARSKIRKQKAQMDDEQAESLRLQKNRMDVYLKKKLKK